MKEHIEDVAPHQHFNCIRMKEGQRDLGIMKKLLEQGRKEEVEPDIELFLAEVNDIVRLLLSRRGITVYQEYRNVIQNAKTLPELSFRKKFGRALYLGASGTYTLLAHFLAFTSRTGRSIIPSC